MLWKQQQKQPISRITKRLQGSPLSFGTKQAGNRAGIWSIGSRPKSNFNLTLNWGQNVSRPRNGIKSDKAQQARYKSPHARNKGS
jgi:hypothetical protein